MRCRATRTTLGSRPRTPGRAGRRVRRLVGAAGPAIDGNGSMRASRWSSVRGGSASFSRCTICERCDLAAGAGLARAGGARPHRATQTTRARSRAPSRSPPAESRRRSGVSRSPPRTNEPANDARRLQQHRAERPRRRGRRAASTASRPAVEQVRREPRADVRPGDEPGERERARDKPRRQPAERRERDDRERDPVDGRTVADVEHRRSASAAATMPRPRGRSSAG